MELEKLREANELLYDINGLKDALQMINSEGSVAENTIIALRMLRGSPFDSPERINSLSTSIKQSIELELHKAEQKLADL